MAGDDHSPAVTPGHVSSPAAGEADSPGPGGPAASPRLWAVYLGGDPEPGRLSEDHEAVLVVAGDLKAARAAGRAKWRGTGRAHVDAVREVDVVDGFAVHLAPTGAPEHAAVDITYEP